MGSAAIVGSDRITVASLDSQVANLQADARPYASQMTVSQSQLNAAVLSWLIRFRVQNEVAAADGISVTQAQEQQALSLFNAQERLQAEESGEAYDQRATYVNLALPQSLVPEFGRYVAQEIAFEELHNGGKLPATTAEQNAVQSQLTKASCQAAKSLSIQVSPQFGRVDYSQQFSIVPGKDTLSRPEGTPSPASTSGLVPAC